LRNLNADSVPGAAIARRLFPSSYALQSMDANTTSVDSGWGGEGVGEGGVARKGSIPNPMQKKLGVGAPALNHEPVPDHGVSNDKLVNSLMNEEIDLSQTPQLPLNGFPFTAHKQSTMDQLYVLFEMVKVKVVFVVAEDKTLEGMISKDLLLKSLKKKVN
jgi:hypothetical protein